MYIYMLFHLGKQALEYSVGSKLCLVSYGGYTYFYFYFYCASVLLFWPLGWVKLRITSRADGPQGYVGCIGAFWLVNVSQLGNELSQAALSHEFDRHSAKRVGNKPLGRKERLVGQLSFPLDSSFDGMAVSFIQMLLGDRILMYVVGDLLHNFFFQRRLAIKCKHILNT